MMYVTLPPFSFAQTTTNPLLENVTITATVLERPGVNPNTPPISPSGPVNTTDILDVVIFRGLAYASSTVSLLKNGILVAEIPTQSDGTFDIRVRNLNPGTYSFGIRAKDNNGLQSKLLLFTVYVSSSVATLVDGIFIPPTITTDAIETKRGDTVSFTGRTFPNAEVRLSFSSKTELLKKAKADASGVWAYELDSSTLEIGDYSAKARALLTQNLSPYSDIINFRIGDTTRLRPKATSLLGFRKKCDLNNDNKVNLLDFSIMAFWYKRLGFPDRVDLNTDKQVNLTDLSILAFCWTG